MPRKDRDTPEYRESNRVYQNNWYHNNKSSAMKTRKKRQDELSRLYQEYKATKKCEKCSENHPACLDFHHSDPSTKDLNPSDLLKRKGWAFEKLKAELDTFEVLCANCHRKFHWEERKKRKEAQNEAS